MTERLVAPTESWRPQRRMAEMDPQIKRMGLVAGGVVALLAVGIGAYTMVGRGPHGVPVIEADSRPLKVRPDNPGGMQIAGADEQIMGGTGSGTGGATTAMAPPPEAPAPGALRAQIRAAREADAPKPVAVPPPPVQPVSLAAPPAPPPAAISAAPEQRPAPSVTAPSATPKPRTAAVEPARAAGGTEVQLAALASQEAAMTEWQRLSKRMPDLLASRHPAVQRVDVDGKTFFRLRTGGFADIAQATAFCTEVRAKGGGCSIASF